MTVSSLARLVPATASVAIHATLAAMLGLAPGWSEPRESVIVLELVEPDPVDAPAPTPARPDPRPITLPRPITRSLPRPIETAPPTPPRAEPPPRVEPPPRAEPPVQPPAPEPPKPAAAAPEPAPAPPVPSAPPEPAPSVAAPSTSGARDAGNLPAGPSAFATADAPTSSAPGASAPGAAGGASGPTVAALPPGGVTQRAIPRGGYQYKPSYPATARRAGVQGTTLLDVLVGDDGRVAQIVVRKSAGHPDLDEAAVEAVRRWRFEPARRGSEAVAMWVQLPVEFRLR